MMEFCLTAIEDDRPISAIYKESWYSRVGVDGVTKIIPYEEHGQMSWVTWFAIYKGDFLYQRIDGCGLLIVYKE